MQSTLGLESSILRSQPCAAMAIVGEKGPFATGRPVDRRLRGDGLMYGVKPELLLQARSRSHYRATPNLTLCLLVKRKTETKF